MRHRTFSLANGRRARKVLRGGHAVDGVARAVSDVSDVVCRCQKRVRYAVIMVSRVAGTAASGTDVKAVVITDFAVLPAAGAKAVESRGDAAVLQHGLQTALHSPVKVKVAALSDCWHAGAVLRRTSALTLRIALTNGRPSYVAVGCCSQTLLRVEKRHEKRG